MLNKRVGDGCHWNVTVPSFINGKLREALAACVYNVLCTVRHKKVERAYSSVKNEMRKEKTVKSELARSSA